MLKKLWLRVYRWYYWICPQHGYMHYGTFCMQCEREKRKVVNEKVEAARKEYNELTK